MKKTKTKKKNTGRILKERTKQKKLIKKSQAKKIINKKKPKVTSKIVPRTSIKPSQQKKKKTKYTTAELKHFKDILLKERDAIIASARANMQSLVDDESGEYVGDNLTYASHMAEQGTDEMEREKNYLFVQRDEKYLGYIQQALARIDQGTYGICIDCIEEPKNLCDTCPLIPKERLELVPITQHCIECKKLRG
ncbi:MAG: conjugal transfer protein TraR [Ignavibacteria bacterium]|nr:conjugal transfer protein TraR [Ignavibacteria bacterium]